MKSVREYIRNRMSTLSLKEWTDEKNVENIPRSLLEKVFHVELSSGTELSQNQTDLVVQLLPTVTIFKIGYRNTSQNADEIFTKIETVIKAVTNTPLAVTQDQMKIIRLENFTVDQINVSNDNIFIAEIVFYVEYIIDINEGV